MLDGLGDFLGGLGEMAGDILGQAGGVKGQWDDIFGDDDSTASPPAQQPTYSPNIQPGDILAQPNYTLLFGGLALLIVALFLMRK